MKSKKKMVFNMVFLAAVFLLTVYGVFHGEDLEAMMDAIRSAQPGWLLLGAALVVLFIWGEALIIWYMMRSFGISLKKRICFLFSSVGFFFSCITPSASGGQPMQVYYMKKQRIPIPVSAVILMVVTITYKLVLVVVGLGIMVFGQRLLHTYMEDVLPVFYLGIILNVGCVSLMTLLVFHPLLAKNLMLKGLGVLERFRLLKAKEERKQRLEEAMQVYQETAAYLKGHHKVIVYVIMITFIQRFCLFAVTWAVYHSFGLTGTPFLDLVLLQAAVSVAVDMLPLPGGMGISESLFLRMFTPVFHTLLLPGMVLSRGLGYYSQLLISAVFTVVAQLYFSRRGAQS